jgi:hypothetical protein
MFYRKRTPIPHSSSPRPSHACVSHLSHAAAVLPSVPFCGSAYCKLGDIEHLHDRLHKFEPGPEPNRARGDEGTEHWWTTSVDPRIMDIFPLKDEEWIRNMGKLWRERGGVIQSVRGMRDVLLKQRSILQEDAQNAASKLTQGISSGRLAQQVKGGIEDGKEAVYEQVKGGIEDGREAVYEAVLPHGQTQWKSPFTDCTILVSGIPMGTDDSGLVDLMEGYLSGCECLHSKVLTEMDPADAEPTTCCGLVTLDHQKSVDVVMAEFEKVVSAENQSSLSLERLKDAVKEFSGSHPRAFKEARRASTAKAAQLAETVESHRINGKLDKWKDPETVHPQSSTDTQRRANSGDEQTHCCDSVLETAPALVHAFQHRDDDILEKMQDEYGPKVAIYFAFLNSYTTSTGALAIIGLVLFVLARTLEWLTYLRVLGLVGLLAASVWAPLTIVAWRRRAYHLLFKWRIRDPEADIALETELDKRLQPDGSHSRGVNLNYNHEQATNPELGLGLVMILCPVLGVLVAQHYNFGAWKGLGLTLFLIWLLKPQRLHLGPKVKLCLLLMVTSCLVVVGFATVLAFNFLLIEYIQYLTTLPLCGTYFHRVSEIQNAYTGGGLFSTNSTVLPVGPDCFDVISSFGLQPPFWTERGFLIFLVGILAALLIDIVYDIVFRLAADVFLNMLNIKMQIDYEFMRVSLYFPFMWSAFMSYFLLAAALVPFGPYIDPMLLRYIHWLTEFKAKAVSTVNNLREAVTDVDELKNFVGESLNDLGLSANHTHSYSSCHGNYTLGGSAGGPQPDAACVFPIKYCGLGNGLCIEYHECTAHDSEIHGQPWCATRSVEEGGWEDGHWGYCDCTGEQHGEGEGDQLDAARTDNLMSYWRYNHRISITLNTLMIGPLVVAVWLDFVFKNLIPLGEHHRRRFLVLRRGEPIGCCARFLIAVTCCCGFHEDAKLQECIGKDDDWEQPRKEFVRRLEKQLVESVEQQVPVRSVSDGGTETANEARATVVPSLKPRSLGGAQRKVLIVTSLSSSRHDEEEKMDRTMRVYKQSNCSKCCAGSCCDPESCCTLRCKACRCGCCKEADETLDLGRHPANYLMVESSMWHYDSFWEYAELVGQFSYITMFTIVFPLGALMAALRNLFEAQWDASRMWRDFKRPVPSRPSPTHPLDGWEDMIRIQTTLACLFTSGFFVRTITFSLSIYLSPHPPLLHFCIISCV